LLNVHLCSHILVIIYPYSCDVRKTAVVEMFKMITQIGNLQIRDDFTVTISGTIVAFRDDDEFLLKDSTGQVWVDGEESGINLATLTIGDQLTVVGDLDDAEDFDARRIVKTTRPEPVAPPSTEGPVSGNDGPVSGNDGPVSGNDGPVSGQEPILPMALPLPPLFDIGALQIRDDFLVTISGTVVAFRDNDEFLLEDSTGQVWVDSKASGISSTNLSLGESVFVVGDLDDAEDFDARQIFSQSELGDPLIGDSLDAGISTPSADVLMAYPSTDAATSPTHYPQTGEYLVAYGDWFDASGYNPSGAIPLVIGFRLQESLGDAGGQFSAVGDLQPALTLV
jgi:uncharacterized protein YdeI (BOF family)